MCLLISHSSIAPENIAVHLLVASGDTESGWHGRKEQRNEARSSEYGTGEEAPVFACSVSSRSHIVVANPSINSEYMQMVDRHDKIIGRCKRICER